MICCSRRQFLKGGVAFVTVSVAAPWFLTHTALAAGGGAASPGTTSSNILVVLQLGGGNDGLNTVIPISDRAYAQARPTIGIAPGAALPIADGVALHSNLARLKALYDQGNVAIVQGVGYPNPDRSHFRSTEIWQTAQPSGPVTSGWLGRYLDVAANQSANALTAVNLGEALSKAFWTQRTFVPSIGNPADFDFKTDPGFPGDRLAQVHALQAFFSEGAGNRPYLDAIKQVTASAWNSSQSLLKVLDSHQPAVDYPQSGLAQGLKLIGRIIGGQLGTRIYYVSMGGFDTHSGEKGTHDRLMAQLDAAVDAFARDMQQQGVWGNVTLMTFSEFGRRLKENGSQGTDHGTAAPMFLVGGGVKGGLVGAMPSLADLDSNGDLKYAIDFRQVYATAVQRWMGVPAEPVVGGTFPLLDLFR